ncbi:hypothetical protein GCM10009601_14740 [Streptomyces thermospinosisporus]|uniref:Uncharacterized protein n=1 Tax=Streptomyces thermospinosisporus TaxID=161482 RepID=A0ABP4JDT8_9ACTN
MSPRDHSTFEGAAGGGAGFLGGDFFGAGRGGAGRGGAARGGGVARASADFFGRGFSAPDGVSLGQ